MENWGLIMVRQKLVVYNPRMNSLRERRVVTDVLAHEWFGNLVTMRWWNDLWLNEGFATMMAPKAADHAENSTLRTTQYFTADVALKALSSDQHLRSTQPISLKKNSDRVHGQDSRILYNKTQYFTADVALKALSSDQHLRSTQPISLKKNSDRVHGQDSRILYNKGATVLRMVESTIGVNVFRRGLNPYLLKFAYSNADKNDFLASFAL
uniref:Peptidase_M1 domain-containing protein n=1 Tax=Ascaris lumbricoides TaxID=6252 RepID=A0A0M3IN86_ASCLU